MSRGCSPGVFPCSLLPLPYPSSLMSTTLPPDTRDDLLAELRRRTTTPGYHFLSPDHLQELNDLQSDGAPIVSLYMELRPEMRVGDSWITVLKDLRDRALAASSSDDRHIVKAELARIEEALQRGLPRTGRGIAFFACESLGLFRQLGTAIALPNTVHVDRRPYIRPLARIRDENDRFVIALLSAHKSRFFFAQIGLVEEVYEMDGEEMAVTDFATKDQRQDIKADLRKTQAQKSAHALQLITETLGARHVIYSAPADMEADFLDRLDQATRQRVAASFACDTNATTAEVSSAVEPVQREVEAREEMETIGKVEELLSTRAVAGLNDTLDMLNQQRVMTLLIDDDMRMPGGIEPSAEMLTTETEGTYAATGGAIEPVGDLVEHMLDKAMAQGASLELVRSEPAKEALRKHGPTAAILRF